MAQNRNGSICRAFRESEREGDSTITAGKQTSQNMIRCMSINTLVLNLVVSWPWPRAEIGPPGPLTFLGQVSFLCHQNPYIWSSLSLSPQFPLTIVTLSFPLRSPLPPGLGVRNSRPQSQLYHSITLLHLILTFLTWSKEEPALAYLVRSTSASNKVMYGKRF